MGYLLLYWCGMVITGLILLTHNAYESGDLTVGGLVGTMVFWPVLWPICTAVAIGINLRDKK